jgi:hypothetical protein
VTGLFPRVDGVFQRIRLSIRFRKDGFRLDCLDVEDRGRVADIDSLLRIIPPRSLPLLPVELSKSKWANAFASRKYRRFAFEPCHFRYPSPKGRGQTRG